MNPPVDETQFVADGHAPPPPATLAPGHDHQRFGRFRVLALVGSGATGAVYRAHDDVLGRAVAIKALHPSCDLAVRSRFLNEARAIGSVLHPNILAVFDAGTEGDTPYMVMELAAGGSLRDAMRAHRIDADGVRRVGIQIARALAAAHAANILHRDVKPANILAGRWPLRGDGDVWKLADFGIARLPDSTLTDTGQFLGSPSYAAPESLRAGQFTPASDVYALAATLYEALAGAPPHGDHDLPSVLRKLEHDPLPLHLRCPVPRAMADTIMAALARDPARRPTADELAQRLATNDDSLAMAVVVSTPSARPSKRIAGIAVAAALVAACLLAVAIVTRVRDTSEARPAVFASPRVDRGTAQAAKPPPSPQPQRRSQPPPQQQVTPPAPADVAPAPVSPAPEPATPAPRDPWGDDTTTPMYDAYGNLVDDDTARRMLQELERDARSEMRRFDRRGRRYRGN